MKRSELVVTGLAMAIGVLAVAAYQWSVSTGPLAPLRLPTDSGWTERHWPLRIDPWWPSKSFTCPAARCGTDITIYVRIKVGFCNCETGVADDPELERIGDMTLLTKRHMPLGAGRPITVSWLKGRVRHYSIEPGASADGQMGVSYGLNDRCDAVVATAIIAGSKCR